MPPAQWGSGCSLFGIPRDPKNCQIPSYSFLEGSLSFPKFLEHFLDSKLEEAPCHSLSGIPRDPKEPYQYPLGIPN